MRPKLDSAPTLIAAPEVGAPEGADPQGGSVGTVIDGRYVLEQFIGEGGMGLVYRARHRIIDKRVAVKVLRGEMARDQEIVERFMQEARTASSIGNAHIVDVSDFGILPDGATFFVMEYLDGTSLGSIVEKTPAGTLPFARIIHVGKQIARGLRAAHAAGIVHRDLKPDNVMLVTRGDDPDFVKILDFGIAKVGTQTNKVTRTGLIVGTPHYMAPEQASGDPLDARADIYALGVMLYELAAGRVPFDAEAVMGVISQHLYKAPTPLSQATSRTDLPPSFEAVVMKCLQKEPARRYPNMDALIADLEAVEAGSIPPFSSTMRDRLPSNAFEPPTGTSGLALAATTVPPPRPSWRRRTMVAGGVVAMLGAFTIFALTPKRQPAIAPAVAAPAELAPPTPLRERLVLLSVDPIDAHVTRDGKDLGPIPIAIRLKEGERAQLLIEKAGFASLTEVLDAASLEGDEARRVVKLVPSAPLAAPKTPRAAPGRPAARSASPTISEHDDPWKRKL